MLSQISRRVGRVCWSGKSSRRHVDAPLRGVQLNSELSSLRSSYSLRRSFAHYKSSGNSIRFDSTVPATSEKRTNERKHEESEIEEDEGVGVDTTDYRSTYIDDARAAAIISTAKLIWPSPPGDIPEGWSCAWENWPLLFSLYWFSPYYLMLPQIDMLVKIAYGIPGETQPLLYYTPKEEESRGKNLFLFTMMEDVDKEKEQGKEKKECVFYLCDCSAVDLYKIDVPGLTELNLVSMLAADPTLEGSKLPLQELEPSEEGLDALRRILDRDETVIPVLAEKFLGYTPEPTEEWQERPELGKEGDESAEGDLFKAKDGFFI